MNGHAADGGELKLSLGPIVVVLIFFVAQTKPKEARSREFVHLVDDRRHRWGGPARLVEQTWTKMRGGWLDEDAMRKGRVRS
ncbi:hypothetical protein ACFXTI_004660 [Malus domestica]